MPITVTTGIRALRRACLAITSHSASPLARAVWMYSWRITSSRFDRAMRAMVPVWMAPSVSAGSTRLAQAPSPYPETGSQPSHTAKSSESIMPSQNTGVEMPSTAALMRS